MELTMYRCETCGSAKLSDVAYGSVWYSICGACGRQTFHERVVIIDRNNSQAKLVGFEFVLEKNLYDKEKKNGDSNTRANQEK